MSATLRQTYVAEPATVPQARAAVVALAQAAGASHDAVDDVRLAVSEAVTNVVMHAYVGVPPGPVQVRAHVEDGRLTVWISDQGGGLRARPDSPGLGVGLPLIAAVTETLHLSNADGEPSCVTMTFRLDTARTQVA